MDDQEADITIPTDPPAITQLKKLLLSQDFEVVSDCGKVLPPKTDVFIKLSDAMSEPLRKKPKNIYTIILENRYNVLTEILKSRNIQNDLAMVDDSLNSTLDTVLEFTTDLTNVWSDIEPELVKYDFQSRGKRELRKLKRHSWTHALYDAIFDETKIPCALKFKNNEIADGGFFVKITGGCPDCGARFLGRIINAPNDNEPIIMECFIYGFDRSVKHNTKRQLKGARRQKIAKEIVEGNLLPCTWRRKEGDRLIDSVGDDEPPHIPSGQVLGKAAKEMRDKILGLINTHNVFESFQDMKFDSIYETSIHSIGFMEFFVHYWSKEQLAVYQKFHQTLYIDGTGSVVRKIKRPSGYSPHIYLYQAVAQVNDKTVPVFQMLSAEHHTDAIANWLFNFLRTGAKEKSSFPVPQEVVTDFDKALLGGVARAFAQHSSLKKYLSACFEFLTGRVSTPPLCILRLDICHLINMISKWKCYIGTPFGAKAMCIRAVAVLRQQETLVAFETVAKLIFILVLSRNAGDGSLSDGARIRLTALIKGIPDIDLADADAEEEYDHNETEDLKSENDSGSKYEELLNSREEVPTNTWDWANNIYEECIEQVRNEQNSESGNVNGFYNAKFAKLLKNLLPYFPLFSETMRRACGTGSKNATSAAVESEFNDLKNRTLINIRQPLRADRFVATHILSLPGKIKLALAGQSEKDALTEVELRKENYNRDLNDRKNRERNLKNESEEEKEETQREKQNTSPISEISYTPETPIKIERDISHTKNSEQSFIDGVELSEDPSNQSIRALSPTLELTAVRSDRKKRRLSLNAAIVLDPVNDAVIELREQHNWRNKNKSSKRPAYTKACPNFDSSNIQKYTSLPLLPNGNHCKNVHIGSTIFVIVNTCAFDSVCQILAMAVCNNIRYKTIVARGHAGIYKCIDILIQKGVVAEIFKERANVLSAIAGLSKEMKGDVTTIRADCNLAGMINNLFVDIPSYVLQSKCSKCGIQKEHPRIFLDINYNPLMSEGIQALDRAVSLGRYDPPKCCRLTGMQEFKYGPHLFIDAYSGRNEREPLSSVPQILTVRNDTQYKLAGVIEFQGPKCINSLGHYIAYCWTGNHWIKYNDNARGQTTPIVSGTTSVEIHACIYTI